MSHITLKNNHEYVDGVVKLHQLLSSACQEAYGIAKKCIPNLSDNTCKLISIFVDFSEEQPDNALKGYFVFDKILFRFLTITFDYALLLPAHDHAAFDSFPSQGIGVSIIENMKRNRVPFCFNFSTLQGDMGTPKLYRIINADPIKENKVNFAVTPIHSIKDEVGCPFTSFEGIEELCLIDIPQRFSSVQYTLVGKQYYAPYSTDKESYCVLFAEKDNKYDCNAIRVLRWFPVSRQCALEATFENVNWGDVFYELGYISRQENAELHSFMLSSHSQLIFAKIVGEKISIIGGVKIFFANDFNYPVCLLKIPVK